jgi:glycosyltransferase involved in cell wall biosynthesis
MTTASVIISTYNRPAALQLVLTAFMSQKYTNTELIVADDGSTQATKTLIDQLNATSPIPINHVWHEDKGFRLAAIRNLAASKSNGEYLIFVDGDCVPFPQFVSNHIKLAEPGWFGTGNRILLGEKTTKDILAHQKPIYQWNMLDLVLNRMSGNLNRVLPAITLPDISFRKRVREKWQGARGCNLAFWKNDFEKVNGFDERYEGWGREDSDILIRLIRSGVMRKDTRFATPLLHLWHPEKSANDEVQNNPLLDNILDSSEIEAKVGLNKYM